MSHQTVQPPEQIKGNLIRHEGICCRYNGDPYRSRDEDEPLPVNVGYASPEEEEATEGEGVGGDDPLEARLGDGEGAADCWQNDDNRL